MIDFNFLTDFELNDQTRISEWISKIIISEGYELGEILYVFCDDAYLHKINLEFLKHDTLTDVITFDYNMGKQINSEIFISVERVSENSSEFGVSFEEELHRVMIHGILHLCGYKDETPTEEAEIRSKEDQALSQLSKLTN